MKKRKALSREQILEEMKRKPIQEVEVDGFSGPIRMQGLNGKSILIIKAEGGGNSEKSGALMIAETCVDLCLEDVEALQDSDFKAFSALGAAVNKFQGIDGDGEAKKH